jgi:hypothetical protein
MAELDMDREFVVLGTSNEEGEYIGSPWFRKRGLGKVLWAFSSYEMANKCFNEPNDETRDVLRDQERIAESNRKLGYGRGFYKITGQELVTLLEQNDLDHVIVDPGFKGWYQRIYKSPHKA